MLNLNVQWHECACSLVDMCNLWYNHANNKGTKANAADENSSFISTVWAKSVPRYHFKIGYVILHMAVKEFLETHFQKWRNTLF